MGVLADDTDPMVSVMKLEKAPTETYADVGGLEQQIQEIKEAVELPLTHPEYFFKLIFILIIFYCFPFFISFKKSF